MSDAYVRRLLTVDEFIDWLTAQSVQVQAVVMLTVNAAEKSGIPKVAGCHLAYWTVEESKLGLPFDTAMLKSYRMLVIEREMMSMDATVKH